jgi:uncharacterized protein with PhoU and TrkA domain
MVDEGEVRYEPVGVKQLVADMKDTAELLVDLAYSAVLFDDPDIARQVLTLEERMDVLQLQARMNLLLAARSPSDAEALAPVLGVIGAAEKISDAGGDIAKVVLDEQSGVAELRAALPEAMETVVSATLSVDSPLAGRTLGDRNLETDTGVRVIAIRRDDEWLLNPGPETALQAGDLVLLRGDDAGITSVAEEVSGDPYAPPEPPEAPTASLERAVDAIVHLKNMSELAIDLAYGAVLFENRTVAEAVLDLEVEVDALQERFEAWVLQAAANADDPVSLRGLLRVARGTETMSDAALEISEGVLRGLTTHQVVNEALAESDEVFVKVTVTAGTPLAGVTLGERELRSETGMHVVAVKRADRGADPGQNWIVSPDAETTLRAGDTLIARGTATGAQRLEALAGGDE